MRVGHKTVYDAIKFNLSNLTEDMYKANEVVASGKRIINPSDDPVGMTQVLKIRSTLESIDQLGRNINMGKSWLTASESALDHIQGLLSDTKGMAIQMASGTANADQRIASAGTVQGMLDEIISLANTEVNGRYIFGGSATDRIPFSADGTYNGNSQPFKVKIGKDSTVELGGNGNVWFESIFNTLSDLKTALASDDTDGIMAAVTNIDEDFDAIVVKISEVGSKVVRMEIKERTLQSLEFSKIERLSSIEDADITEAITDLQSRELVYKASLASSARIMELSLVDYIR